MGIRLLKSDIHVAPITKERCECHPSIPVTHVIDLDVRSMGCVVQVFKGCKECCERQAVRLRQSLPDGDDDGN